MFLTSISSCVESCIYCLLYILLPNLVMKCQEHTIQFNWIVVIKCLWILSISSSMFVRLVSSMKNYIETKTPSYRVFISGELGGWFMMCMSRTIFATIVPNCSLCGGTCEGALSYIIHMVCLTSSWDHFGIIAGNSLVIMYYIIVLRPILIGFIILSLCSSLKNKLN